MFGYTLAPPVDTNGDAIPEFVFGMLGLHLRVTMAGGRVFTIVSARQPQRIRERPACQKLPFFLQQEVPYAGQQSMCGSFVPEDRKPEREESTPCPANAG